MIDCLTDGLLLLAEPPDKWIQLNVGKNRERIEQKVDKPAKNSSYEIGAKNNNVNYSPTFAKTAKSANDVSTLIYISVTDDVIQFIYKISGQMECAE